MAIHCVPEPSSSGGIRSRAQFGRTGLSMRLSVVELFPEEEKNWKIKKTPIWARGDVFLTG